MTTIHKNETLPAPVTVDKSPSYDGDWHRLAAEFFAAQERQVEAVRREREREQEDDTDISASSLRQLMQSLKESFGMESEALVRAATPAKALEAMLPVCAALEQRAVDLEYGLEAGPTEAAQEARARSKMAHDMYYELSDRLDRLEEVGTAVLHAVEHESIAA